MKNLNLFFLILTISLTSFAAQLSCKLNLNSEVRSQITVDTEVGKKISVAKSGQAIAYLTEKAKNEFSLEAFLPNDDSRIYSEGFLRSSQDKLNLSYWGRDILIEIQCLKIADFQ